MSKYEVSNSQSGHSFGVYEAESAEAAILACCFEAGYASQEQAEEAMGRATELVAVEVQ
jgi:malonyl CoA-acyl carrier protein transacylase